MFVELFLRACNFQYMSVIRALLDVILDQAQSSHCRNIAELCVTDYCVSLFQNQLCFQKVYYHEIELIWKN